MELLIVTGQSAGKTRVINALEDIGYYCVDNIPPALLGDFADLNYSPAARYGRTAIVMDARSGRMFRGAARCAGGTAPPQNPLPHPVFRGLRRRKLLRRYKENRRRHPLLRLRGEPQGRHPGGGPPAGADPGERRLLHRYDGAFPHQLRAHVEPSLRGRPRPCSSAVFPSGSVTGCRRMPI